MPKIAFISTIGGSAWGGSEELWSQTAKLLAKHGNTVAVNVKWAPNPSPKIAELEVAGCRVIRRGEVRSLRHRIARKMLPAGEYQRVDRSPDRFRWLDDFRPDLVVINQGGTYSGVDWMLACAERRLRFAPIVQAASESGWPPEDVDCSRAFESAAAVYFVSEGNLELVRRQLGSCIKNGRVVRNPFNVDYDIAPSTVPESEGVVRWACVGRLQPAAKGQDILFDVLRQDVWRRRPLEITLYGQGGGEANLRRLQQLYELENVRFAGFSNDVASIWANHHALILPSRCEGLPLALVEAMLCGRSCIVTDVPGNAELIDDNVTGFVAAAPKADFLAEAMERAWARRDEWWQIGQEAAKRVRQVVPKDPIGAFAGELQGLIN